MSLAAYTPSVSSTAQDGIFRCLCTPCLCPWWKPRIQPIFDYDEIDDLEFENLLSSSGATGPFQSPPAATAFWESLASLFRFRSLGFHTNEGAIQTDRRNQRSFSYTYNYSPVRSSVPVYGATGDAGGQSPNHFFNSRAVPADHSDFILDSDDALFGQTEADAVLMTDEQIHTITAAASSIRHLGGDALRTKSNQNEYIQNLPQALAPPTINHGGASTIQPPYKRPSSIEADSMGHDHTVDSLAASPMGVVSHASNHIPPQQHKVHRSNTNNMLTDPLNAVQFLVETDGDVHNTQTSNKEDPADDLKNDHFDADLLLKLKEASKDQ
ncbi:hypothetical protein BATDEDRAFT_85321 [Batrachochytrium dendrobatidis JAM81]|uniref:Uncharacterized protein n=2 Tax=Batrachochytrium dendrobatidis TaxID=109871 RepID=F4NT06_BATDJ|nr:uncharacterized protein BATDEDRAFT_85321 [Batrachochytrium dendrobatidis JAM81]EGF84291.1 hypothetical protein BATDEDRAFT_85321 [Batrachochytrium dendrobatidis JAM81]KAK5668050.1 hypothetical protein QVD99_005091 [Batrachochytrium dendrobatidis]OAJ37124.1 hypothetical protein BDEG_21189 [Batrachochytrium dendrobatidis JEL423]|eukprot:XP_006676396.1 hypothetical protein BATDEDRAFT_85321 [Batrachochytrium dendrobatidis JAM81]